MSTPWFRLTLDLDYTGNWRGLSYVVRVDDRLIEVTVLPEPGPFEDGGELLNRLIEWVTDRYGVQLKIW